MHNAMHRLLAAALLVLPSAAMASDFGPGDRIAASCAKGTLLCNANRKQITTEWPKALQGDYQAQRNVAFCLSSGCDGAVRPDPVLGCAWRIAILAARSESVDDSDNGNFRSECGRLSDIDLAASKVSAARLFQEIHGKMLPPPPWEWLKPVEQINLSLGPGGNGAIGMVKVAIRVAFQCPGAVVDQGRVNAIMARLGVPSASIPGGEYDAAAVYLQMERDYPGYRKELASRGNESTCRTLDENYGRAGLYLPGLASVPLPARYPK